MLSLPSSVRIYFFAAPTDMRKGFDGLAALVKAAGLSEFSGHLFVFVSRRGDRAKVLSWERGGFVLWYNKSTTARQRRRKALEKLPVVHEQVAVAVDQLPEGMSLDDFRPLGDGEVVRRIEHVREHLVVVEYHLQKLVERGGERIVQASPPPNVIDGGAWGPSVYAHVTVRTDTNRLHNLGSPDHRVARHRFR